MRALPSYQFDQQEGQRAVDRSAAARGMDASGRTLKDLTRFGTGLSDQTYGNQLTRLLGLNLQGFSQGMSALGAQNSAYGAVTGEVANWAGAIMAFYFGKRGIENVARIVGNRFGGR